MQDTTSQFHDAIRATGLQPPDVIIPGKYHRFPGYGKRKANKAGWCKLFSDFMGGCFGDFSSGLSESWQAKRDKKFTAAERTAFTRQIEEARAKADEGRNEKYAKAAKRARSIWDASSRESEDYPYLATKGISGSGARIHKGELVVPLLANGTEIAAIH